MQQGYRILGEIHSHPTGSTMNINPQGGICPKQALFGNSYTLYDGPSGSGQPNTGQKAGDLDPWETGANAGMTGYIIDPLHVHRWERIEDSQGNWQIVKQRFNLNKGANRCIV
jgi:hypothetical protein